MQSELDQTTELIGAAKDSEGSLFLVDGQTFTCRIVMQQDCYLRVWYEDGRGRIIQLYPNQKDEDRLHRLGSSVTVPHLAPALQVTADHRRQQVHVLASTHRFPSIEGESIEPYVAFISNKARVRWLEWLKKITDEGKRADTSDRLSQDTVSFHVRTQ